MPATPNSMILPQAIRRTGALCTAAKSTYADGANAVLLASGGTNGSILRKLSAIALATVSSATQLQLYAYDGTNYRLIPNSPLMPTFTMSGSTANTSVTDFGFTDSNTLYVPSGWSLYVAIGVALAGGIVFSAELGDF